MGVSNNLPCSMCPSCRYYKYRPDCTPKHLCQDSSEFKNPIKLGCNPDIAGSAAVCKCFKSK